MLRISDSNWIGVPVRILPKLWSVRCHVIRRARVQEPCAQFLNRKQNFWFDWVLNGQYVRVGRQNFGWRADVIDLLMPTTLLIRSLSFFVFGFECTAIGFDVSRFLAIMVDSEDDPFFSVSQSTIVFSSIKAMSRLLITFLSIRSHSRYPNSSSLYPKKIHGSSFPLRFSTMKYW